MRNKKLLCLLLSGVMAVSIFTGCSESTGLSNEETKTTEKSENLKKKKHEPITIMDGNRDYTKLQKLIKQKYPEIDLKIEAYQGANTTVYMSEQLETGDMPDIYSSTGYWDEEWQKENLVDLSGYSFTDKYNEVRLNECDVDGALYLIPYDYQVISPAYNKTLFEQNGWKVPDSFDELEELAPEIKKAGVRMGVSLDCLPGYGFQHFFNIADTVFLSTNEGREWKTDFLEGKAGAIQNLQGCKDYFQKWIDIGLLDERYEDLEVDETRKEFYKGNVAFFVGGLDRYTQNEDGTGDQYAVLPYLSQDGTQNMYITLVSRYYGINKKLLQKGNEQKLEDAVHVLEIMSTLEGYESILSGTDSEIGTLKACQISKDNPYYDVIDDINGGHSAPMVYTGWEDYIVDFGEKVQDWIDGKCTGDDALAVLDKINQESEKTEYYGEAEDDFDTHQCAVLSGKIFLDATDADCALISENEWKKGVSSGADEDNEGANGKLYKGKITDGAIVVFLPTGWYDTIKTVTLSGKRIRELSEEGYDKHGDGNTYPYTLVAKDKNDLEDDQEYTVVICGATDEVLKEGKVQDTEITGLDAAKEYLRSAGKISTSMLDEGEEK